MLNETTQDATSRDRAMTALRALLQAGDAYRQNVAGYFSLGWTEIQAVGHLLGADDLGQTELAHRLGITTGAATALVDRLEKANIAARHPHPQDRRRSIIRLTDRGYRVVEVSRNWTQHAFDGVDPAAMEDLAETLTSMATNLNQQSNGVHALLDSVERAVAAVAPAEAISRASRPGSPRRRVR